MKKVRLLYIFILVCLILCSCAGKPAQNEVTVPENNDTIGIVSLADVRDEIITELKVEESMYIETESLNSLYGIDTSVVKQSASFVTMAGTFPHEVILIEAKDSVSVKGIVEALEKKLSEVLVQSKSYDATNYKLAQQCKVNTKGCYVTLLLSPDHTKMQTILNKYI